MLQHMWKHTINNDLLISSRYSNWRTSFLDSKCVTFLQISHDINTFDVKLMFIFKMTGTSNVDEIRITPKDIPRFGNKWKWKGTKSGECAGYSFN